MQRASPTGGQPQQEKELFNLPYPMERLALFGNLMSDELAATATALTARTVAAALELNDVPEVVRPSIFAASSLSPARVPAGNDVRCR
jgi:hypothetical protein